MNGFPSVPLHNRFHRSLDCSTFVVTLGSTQVEFLTSSSQSTWQAKEVDGPAMILCGSSQRRSVGEALRPEFLMTVGLHRQKALRYSP